jgi:hypothetical protein
MKMDSFRDISVNFVSVQSLTFALTLQLRYNYVVIKIS